MKKDRLFLDLVAVVSLMISFLFFVGFFVKDKPIGQTAVNFAPFADCTVKVSTVVLPAVRDAFRHLNVWPVPDEENLRATQLIGACYQHYWYASYPT